MTDEKHEGCGVLTLKAALVLGAGFFRVYAIVTLCRWFLNPLGVPAVGFWQMCGIGTLLGLFRWKAYDPEEGKRLLTWQHVSAFCLAPAFSLGVGWVYLWLAR